ncbi:MAG: glycosyltransferase family 2 protein [Betaproteobacteria bacterium]
MSDLLIALAIWSCLLLSGLPLLYLLATTLAALSPRLPYGPEDRFRRIVILIPAHNESLLISGTVKDALLQNYPNGSSAVFVIADNCSDDTAELARQAGARILERQGNPGKGQGLHEALELLMQEDWDAFVVMDADSRLHRDTLKSINAALADGSRALQIRYGVLNPTDSIRTYAMELSTASFNALRPLGKSALGISAGINGNGFCITRQTVKTVPYLAHSIVEDIEYHMLLLKAGIRVDFLDQVWVKAQMPIGGRGSEVQRVRWERGRVATIRTYAPGLFRDLLQGQRRALDGLIDVLMPPVSLVFLGLMPALACGNIAQRSAALAGIAILAGHYLLAAWRYGSFKGLLLLSAYIPWYVLWKSYIVIASMITEKNLPWVRTDRHKHDD